MASDVIDDDGVYTDAEGNRFQYRKGHVLAPGEKKNLKKVGAFPDAEATGAAEQKATEPSAEKKAAQKPEDKKAPAPENKSQ